MKALVIGLGKSGRGAAKLLLKLGYVVHAIDRVFQKMEGVSVYLEDEVENIEADLVILSPGIPRSHPHARGNVIGEAELGLRFLKNVMVGITGTNGKTTLTLLVTHVLNASGVRARALGNVGISLAEYACSPDPGEVLVVELSSYQLETLQTVAFDVGLITNITPDHLDRYPSFKAYKDTKLRLKELVKEGGIFIGEKDVELMGNGSSWQLIGPCIVSMAWKICKFFGVNWEHFNAALATFNKPPHRMEVIDVVEGITFINDSKGTNIESVMYGVGQIEGPIFLIAGGKSKGDSFEKWKKPFKEKVKKVFAIGETSTQIKEELGEVIPTLLCKDLGAAVAEAKKVARSGDTILLSPGCASFDQFKKL